MDEPVAFGELLRRHRVAGGLTQEALAERAGIGVRTVSDLERGLNHTPRKETLRLLLRALSLSPEDRAVVESTARRLSRPLPLPPVNSLHLPTASSSAEAGEDPVLRIRLLGGFRVQVGERNIEQDAWKLRKARALVKLLALAPGHQMQREQIMDLLWSELESQAAGNSLHQTLHVARHILAPHKQVQSGYLRLRDQMLSLAEPHALWIDVDAFEAAAAAAHRGTDLALYRVALDLYAGELLPEDCYEDWSTDRRQSLHQMYLSLLLNLARLHEDRRQYMAAGEALQRIVAADQVHEEGHVGLMRLYALRGARHEALRQYEMLEEALRRELGVLPQPASRNLYQEILAGRVTQSLDGAIGAAQPQPSQSQPADIGRNTGPSRLHNLPMPVNSFIGRVREQAEVRQLVHGTRLLTLTGAGGCGKTRLALQVAAALLPEFPDGVWLVELASLGQSGLVPQAVSAALGVLEQASQPQIETLAAYLHARDLLLLLDNCEHLIDACASLVETLLRGCGHLRILCTSREPLHIAGEVTMPVRSLALPDPRAVPPLADLLEYEAIQLFSERANANLPAFAVNVGNAPAVAQICYRLDGMPLALELAAARVRVLSVQQIEARLDDCFRLLTGGSRTAMSRQQTLRATLDWSYDLLSPDEQYLFRQLAVFAGGFNLDGAEVVGAQGPESECEILDLLNGLVDKSLILLEAQESEARYRLLEPVRQYARQALERAGEAMAARRRHSDWCLAVAERADALLWTAAHGSALTDLEREHDNLRAALGWGLTSDSAAAYGLRLASSLWQFWLLRGYFMEGRRWFESLLAAVPDPSVLRLEVLLRASCLIARRGDLITALALAEQGRVLCQALGDRRAAVQASYIQGIIVWVQLEYEQARIRLEEGLRLANETGSPADSALFTHALGMVAWTQGDYASAQALMETSLQRLRALEQEQHIAIAFLTVGLMPLHGEGVMTTHLMMEDAMLLFREMGMQIAAGYVLANLGNVTRTAGDYPRAKRLLEESLEVFRDLQDVAGIAQVAGQLGNLSTASGDYEQARPLLEESLKLRKDLGDRRGIVRCMANLGHLAMAIGDYVQARSLFEEGMAQGKDMEDRPSMAWLQVDLGNLAIREGAYDLAYGHFEEVYNRFQQLGHVQRGMAVSRSYLGMLARVQGDMQSALAHLKESLKACEEVGDRRASAVLLYHLGELALHRSDRDEARTCLTRSLAYYRKLGDARGVALVVNALADVARVKDQV